MGGPVETSRGFRSAQPRLSGRAGDHAGRWGKSALTATVDILRAIARGRGPRDAMLALGYAGWSAGQLETEIQRNGWLNCPADPEIVFDPESQDKYERALRRIGIYPAIALPRLHSRACVTPPRPSLTHQSWREAAIAKNETAATRCGAAVRITSRHGHA